MIYRRVFLQRLAATAASMALDPLQGISTEGNVYENTRLKLSLQKPTGWTFASIADFAALRDRQVLEGVLATEPNELRDPSVLPVFLFENNDYRIGKFVPAICLYDSAHGGLPQDDFCPAHLRMLNRFSKFYTAFNIANEPQEFTNGSVTLTRANWSYVHTVDDGESVPLSVTSILCFNEARVHTYYFVDHRDTPFIADHVREDFIRTIRYSSVSKSTDD